MMTSLGLRAARSNHPKENSLAMALLSAYHRGSREARNKWSGSWVQTRWKISLLRLKQCRDRGRREDRVDLRGGTREASATPDSIVAPHLPPPEAETHEDRVNERSAGREIVRRGPQTFLSCTPKAAFLSRICLRCLLPKASVSSASATAHSLCCWGCSKEKRVDPGEQGEGSERGYDEAAQERDRKTRTITKTMQWIGINKENGENEMEEARQR